MTGEVEEVRQSLEMLRHEFEDLAVGGLRTVGPERLPLLRNLEDSFKKIGALHLASRLGDVANSIERDDGTAAEALMKAQASQRSFERLLTLEVARGTLNAFIATSEEEAEEHA